MFYLLFYFRLTDIMLHFLLLRLRPLFDAENYQFMLMESCNVGISEKK